MAGFHQQFWDSKKISGDSIVKKIIVGCLILAASLPMAFIAGCSSSNAPTSGNATSTPTANATSTFTPTSVPTIVPAGPAALALGAASSTGPGGNFSLLVGVSDTESTCPSLSGNVGGSTNGAVASGTDVLIGCLSSPLFTSTGTSANIYWTTGGVSPDPHGYAIAANVAVFGAGGAYYTGSTEAVQTPLNVTEIGGLSLRPGTWTSTGALTLGSSAAKNLILNNAGGNPNNCYIFVTAASSNLTTYAGSSITLINVKAANVFWIVQGSAELAGTTTSGVPGFIGTLMCSTSITFDANASLEGHAFCNAGSISFAAGNVVSYP
jgi:hypothetical protein